MWVSVRVSVLWAHTVRVRVCALLYVCVCDYFFLCMSGLVEGLDLILKF